MQGTPRSARYVGCSEERSNGGRHTTKIGRNEPCPCGSGKKYKKCCLNRECEERARKATRIEREEKLREAVFDFIFDDRFADEIDIAEDIFFAGGPLHYDTEDKVCPECGEHLVTVDAQIEEILEVGPGEKIDEDTVEMPPDEKPIEWDEEDFYDKDDLFNDDFDEEDETLFNLWYFHDYVSDRYGSDMVSLFEKEKGGKLDEADREILASWKNTILGLFEVVDVEYSKGVLLRDLLTDERYFVRDISLSKSVFKWDCIFMRLNKVGEEWGGIGTCRILSQPQADVMKETIESKFADSGVPTLQDYLHKAYPSISIMHRIFYLLSEFAPMPELRTMDGEAIIFSKATYKILDKRKVGERLEKCSEIDHTEEEEAYTWYEEIPEEERRFDGERRILGSITIDGGKLTLECNSRERLARGRELLSGIMNDGIVFIKEDFEDVGSAMERMEKEDKGKGRKKQETEEIPEELRRRLKEEYLLNHYKNWLDMDVPALEGQTPRQAVKTTDGKQKLIEMLKDIENMAMRDRGSLKAVPWVEMLKNELGIEKL